MSLSALRQPPHPPQAPRCFLSFPFPLFPPPRASPPPPRAGVWLCFPLAIPPPPCTRTSAAVFLALAPPAGPVQVEPDDAAQAQPGCSPPEPPRQSLAAAPPAVTLAPPEPEPRLRLVSAQPPGSHAPSIWLRLCQGLPA
eukprot:48589-Rhodomonas_salina.1